MRLLLLLPCVAMLTSCAQIQQPGLASDRASPELPDDLKLAILKANDYLYARRAVQTDRDDVAAWLTIASYKARVCLPGNSDAMAAWRQALSKEPDNLKANFWLAAGFASNRQYDKAKDSFSKALTLAPRDSQEHAYIQWRLDTLQEDNPNKGMHRTSQ